MAKFDEQYNKILEEVFLSGYKYNDPNRDGVQRLEIPMINLYCKPKEGFPALTVKEVYYKGAFAELLFFMSGSTDIRKLWEMGVRFWDKDWARYNKYSDAAVRYLYDCWKRSQEEDDLKVLDKPTIDIYDMGKIYPHQWRNANGVDQLYNLVYNMIKTPMSTSLIVNSWNPGDMSEMCLPPCHYSFQVICQPVNDTYKFSLVWNQRSTDFFLGTPVNIMFYTALAQILELFTGYKCTAVIGELKNVHLYDNQIEAAEELMQRNVNKYSESKLEINKDKFKNFFKNPSSLNFNSVINSLSLQDFNLVGYESYPKLKVEMLSYNKKQES
jgi:thymidylate synthase